MTSPSTEHIFAAHFAAHFATHCNFNYNKYNALNPVERTPPPPSSLIYVRGNSRLRPIIDAKTISSPRSCQAAVFNQSILAIGAVRCESALKTEAPITSDGLLRCVFDGVTTEPAPFFWPLMRRVVENENAK